MADPAAAPDPAATLVQEVTAHDLAPAPTPAPPGFDLLAEVGRGGMGVVYRARDRELGREVAVKVLAGHLAPGSAAAGRFAAEARVTAGLQHPGVPAVHRAGRLADGRPFLAMTLVRGRTLADLLGAGAVADPAGVFAAVCQAVGYAHSMGVVHRDLKPANVMVGAFGEVQVMDWGLAKVLADGREAGHAGPTAAPDADAGRTHAGAVLGTPAYMAPEQARGEPVDARADVFGLGAVLCELLTGRPPFAGPDAAAAWQRAAAGDLADARRRLAGCGADPALAALGLACLAPEPAGRPADAGAVADAVAALRAATADRARAAERDAHAAAVREAEGRKRRRLLGWAGAGLAGVLLLGLAGTTAGLVRADAARHAARADQRTAELKALESAAAQRAEADQRRAAEEARADAEAVVRFVEDRVFAAARPVGRDGGLGPAVTLRAAVAAALPALAGGLADRPRVEARLRLALGTTLYYLGDPAGAAAQQRRAADLWAAALGPDHPDARRALSNLALSLDDLGRPAEALALREADLAAARRALPAGHQDLLKSVNNLANSYSAAGRHADAVRLHGEALAGREAALGPDHLDTLGSRHNLAAAHAAAGRHADALRLNEGALAGFRRAAGADHPDALKSAANLAASYARAGRAADALALRLEVLGRQRRVLGPDHPDARATAAVVVRGLVAAGRAGEAVPVATELAERWEAQGRGDLEGLYTAACGRAALAGALGRAGRAAEAGAAAARAMEWLAKAVGAGLRERELLRTDPDLDPVRGRADFRALLAGLPEAAPPPRPAE